MMHFKQRVGIMLVIITLCANYYVLAQATPEVEKLSEAATQKTAATVHVSTETMDLPDVFTRRAPKSISDLQAIEQHVRSILPKVEAATVHLQIGNINGSGVVITKAGLILTAAHVSGDPGRPVRIRFPNGNTVSGRTLGRLPFEPPNDVADIGLVKITEEGEYPAAALGTSGTLEKLDWCFALGHPGGWNGDRGPVLRVGRVWQNIDRLAIRRGSFISTDCVLLGGDSGGPLFDMHGRVIGINSRIARSTTQNMHAPVDAYFIYEELMLAGEVYRFRGHLGIGVERVTDGIGVRVETLIPGFPADNAGIKFGDVITKIEGNTIRDERALSQVVKRFDPGQVIKISMLRGNEVVIREATVGDIDLYNAEMEKLEKAAADYRRAILGEPEPQEVSGRATNDALEEEAVDENPDGNDEEEGDE